MVRGNPWDWDGWQRFRGWVKGDTFFPDPWFGTIRSAAKSEPLRGWEYLRSWGKK